MVVWRVYKNKYFKYETFFQTCKPSKDLKIDNETNFICDLFISGNNKVRLLWVTRSCDKIYKGTDLSESLVSEHEFTRFVVRSVLGP